MLAPAPADTAGTVPFEPKSWQGDLVEREAADGLHAVLRTGAGEHRLWLPHPIRPGEPMACVVPLGSDAAAGAAAAIEFWRHICGVRGTPSAPDHRFRRLCMSLRAFDARVAGASYRALAEYLFGTARIEDRSWKTSSIRDTTIRLVRSGRAYVQGNYRRLLRQRADERRWVKPLR